MMEKIRVGIFGVGRGTGIGRNFMMAGCDIVAICDVNKTHIKYAKEAFGQDIKVYDKFDDFINHEMDAVILTNSFHEHAPYAIKCFEKGLHVFSECISNGTMAEGVELIRAFEKSNVVYMLAENYPQMKHNIEMRRLVKGGTLGKILYAEGEYNHPGPDNDVPGMREITYFEKHWRNWLPRTYYITHSLGPVMRITGATPKKVVAFASFAPPPDGPDAVSATRVGDRVGVITTQNDDGSVFRVTGCAKFGGGGHNFTRICGTNGQVENFRGSLGAKLLLRYDPHTKPAGRTCETIYEPEWGDQDEALIVQSGHGGGDFITARMFVEAIKEGKQPEHPFDIYSAVTMSSVAILGHRSVLAGGKTFDIPDFRKEEDCKLYENDRLTPFWGFDDGSEPNLPCCSHPDYKPSDTMLANYRKLVDGCK